MTVFKSPDQLILLPTIGLVRENNGVYLNLSWLCYGININIIKYE